MGWTEQVNRETYTLLGNIGGQFYKDLLRFALEYCDKFVLVIRPTLELSDDAKSALDKLSTFMHSSSEKSEWPGTELLLGTAKVNEYQFDIKSLDLLLSLSNNIYDWEQPFLPEDLALIRKDGLAFLGSISHEKDAFLNLTEDERKLLKERFPKLVLKSS